MSHISGIAVRRLKHTSRNVRKHLLTQSPHSSLNLFASGYKCHLKETCWSQQELCLLNLKSSLCTTGWQRRDDNPSEMRNDLELSLDPYLASIARLSCQGTHIKCSWKAVCPFIGPPSMGMAKAYYRAFQQYHSQCRSEQTCVSETHQVWVLLCLNIWWG